MVGAPRRARSWFLDPGETVHAARLTGLYLGAHLDPELDVSHEHPSRRSYLLLRKTTR